MTKTFAFGSLLLLSSALVAPAAMAQQSGGSAPPEAPPAPESPPADATATDPDATPAPEQQQDDQVEISIPGADIPQEGGEIIVTGQRGPSNILRRSPQVLSVLSTEDIARTGEGDIAGALSRVTGLSLVNSGFVYVRGLGDRYSLALLNGSPIPSPEPLRRVVPLDIFPTGLIASSLVQKTYSPNFPGEFGGGVINLTTRAIPDEAFIQIGGSISGDTETTFNLGYTYYGSDTDWTGFDDGSRNTPAGLVNAVRNGGFGATTARQRQDFAAALTNAPTTLLQRNRDVPGNGSISITGGASTPIFGDGRLGVIAGFGWSSTWRTRDALQQTSGDPNLAGLTTSFNQVSTDQRVLVNGLLGFGLEVGEHVFRWTNVFIRDTLKQGRLASGFNVSNGDQDPNLPDQQIIQNTYWFERQLIDTQFVAELDFGALDIDLRAGYANTQRESPYERDISYFYLGDGNPATRSQTDVDDYINSLTGAGQFARIAFSDLSEDLYSAGVDVSYRSDALSTTLTAGYAYQDTQRSSYRYEFRYERLGANAGSGLPIEIAQQRPDYLLSDFNIYTFNVGLNDISGASGTPAYDAGLTVNAAYGQADIDLFAGLTVSGGVRFESATQTVQPSGVGLAATNLENEYFLPSLTVTYAITPEMQVRFHESRTIARPQFRELAQQVYRDFESNREFSGNPFLRDSVLNNYELRYEYFYARNQRFAVSGFYKEISNPIESAAFFAGGNVLRVGFANAPSAELYGAEVEFQTYVPLDSLGGFFSTRRILFIANYTYTQSSISTDGSIVIGPSLQPIASNVLFQEGAPLTGQSEHLYNLQISLEDTERLSQLTFLMNYASERVSDRGPIQGLSRQPDIVQRPGTRIDVVARQAVSMFGGEAEFQAEVRNIFGTDFREFQQAGANRISINSYDVGTTFSLGLSVRF